MGWMIVTTAMQTLTAKIEMYISILWQKEIFVISFRTININNNNKRTKKRTINDKNFFLPYQFKYIVINNHH